MKNLSLSKAIRVLIVMVGCTCAAKIGRAEEFLPFSQSSLQAVIVPVAEARKLDFLSRQYKTCDFWLPAADQLTKVEAVLPSFLGAESKTAKTPRFRRSLATIRERLPSYRRQYIGLITKEGKKQILINCFPAAPSEGFDPCADWKSTVIGVLDGGIDFWQAIFDLDSESFRKLSINTVGDLEK